MRHRFTAGLLTATLSAGLFSIGLPASHASSKGRKNVAIGLGALAAYELLTGKTGTGLLAGAGAAYAYKRYRDARKKERRYYFPSGYSGNSYGRYQYGSQYQPYGSYPNGEIVSYGNRSSLPFVTDEWGNRHYYNPRYGDGFHRYDGRPYHWARHRTRSGRAYDRVGYYQARYDGDGDRDDRPPGWSHGNKRGWRGHSVPPGHWRKD